MERRRPGSGREVGALSADGSRVWDGSYWIRVETERSQLEAPSPTAHASREYFIEKRRPGLLGVFVATIVGIVLTHLHFDVPAVVGLDAALAQIVVTNLLWWLFSYGTVIVILSIGFRGVDVMLLRSMLVAFFFGLAFIWLSPLNGVLTGRDYALTLLISGVSWMALVGPILAVYATLANLLVYRDLNALRPQLWFLAG